MSYKLIENGVVRQIDDTVIPNDPLNWDWQKYQKWLAGGGISEPADPEPTLLDPITVEEIVDALDDEPKITALKARLV